MNKQTIVLTGGGTAGHVTPHLVLLPDLKKYFSRIEYIGSKNGIEKRLAKEKDIPYHHITTCKFVRKKLLKNLLIPFRLAKGTHQAKKVLKQIRPSVVFSKGGFVSVPVVRAANKLKIPVIAHESDKSPGLANRLNSKKCKVVFTTFKETASKLKNGVHSGPPLAPPLQISKVDAKSVLGKNKSLPLLLITGGSSGAVALNKAIEKALPVLVQMFQVHHLTGKGNQTSFVHKNYYQQEFSNQMALLMRAADFCITRGGSNTIFELANNQIPMLIVPLPKGNSRGDQEENAAYFSSKGLSKTLPQSNLSTESLVASLKDLQKEANKQKEKQSAFLSINANQIITKALVETSQSNHK